MTGGFSASAFAVGAFSTAAFAFDVSGATSTQVDFLSGNLHRQQLARDRKRGDEYNLTRLQQDDLLAMEFITGLVLKGFLDV